MKEGLKRNERKRERDRERGREGREVFFLYYFKKRDEERKGFQISISQNRKKIYRRRHQSSQYELQMIVYPQPSQQTGDPSSSQIFQPFPEHYPIKL